MKIINYNTAKYNFAERVSSLFNINDLALLNDNVEVFKRENDQNTNWHRLFYNWARTPEFTELYEDFIANVIKPIYSEQIVYQAIPTFRVAYPNNIAVGEFHKDKHYRNGEWAAMVREDNFYLPFTDAYDTNTIWVESAEDKGDFAPMNCRYGECVQWDGCNLTHGNKINITGKARISVDFRVIKFSNYVPSEYSSINTKVKFQIGGYYKTV